MIYTLYDRFWHGLLHPGARLNIKTVFLVMGFPMLKIRWSRDHLFFNMGIPIPRKTAFFFYWDAPSIFWKAYLGIPGNILWEVISWFSPRTNPFCSGKELWRCLWTICCCKLNRTVSDSLACGSEKQIYAMVNVLTFWSWRKLADILQTFSK